MICYICLGSNQGNTENNLAQAVEHICQHPLISLLAKSSVYKTEPQGDKDQEWFANQVISVEYAIEGGSSERDADMLMQYLLGVEAGMGRVRDETRRFGPRVIDIDIICFGSEQIQTKWVCVPHPRALERAFVLIPLQEIAPHISIQGMPIGEALQKIQYSVDENKIFQ